MAHNENANLYLALMAAGAEQPLIPLFHLPTIRAGDSPPTKESTLTYGAMTDRAEAIAAGLQHWGLQSGDRLVAQVEKSADVIALWLACLRSGIVLVPLNTAYTDLEVDAFVADAETEFLITTPERRRGLTFGSANDGTFSEIIDAAARSRRARPPIFDAKPDDPAAMLFTSGTTGRSKGAVLTHRGLLSNADALAEVWGVDSKDHLLHTLPVFHVHGLFVALHPLMLRGAQITFLPRFSPAEVIKYLPECSVFMGVPTHYTRLLADTAFTRSITAATRLFTSGSAPMTTKVHQEFTERTGRTITERYGMTECGIITSNDPHNPLPGTVGRPIPQMELRIGANSVVEVRGPHLLHSYWNRPDATADAFTDDGWFITGDIGTVDANGVVSLSGRSSDLIISGGYNIYPKEVEQVLDADPRVKEAAVVGWPDPEWGEVVVAFIVLKPDQISVAQFDPPPLTELARFKHPRRFEVVEELPRNAMGKVQKKLLRQRAPKTEI